jgi:hypothetical protein
MEAMPIPGDDVVAEHFLASLYGSAAAVLVAVVWSSVAAVFGLWSLLAAPGAGWLIGWACRHGGRRLDTAVRVTGWLLSASGAALALLAFSAFSAGQASPDAGLQLRVLGVEYLRLFAEPPWFGSAAVLLALNGTSRALRDRPSGRAVARQVRSLPGLGEGLPGAGAPAALDGPDSRAA